MEKYELQFWTEYYQFYLMDAETKATTDADDFWNDEAGIRRLAIGEGLLGVSVAKYATINVEVRILTEPSFEDTAADHIVETSLRLPSGQLEVRNCTNNDLELALNLGEGTYRVRISSFNLGTVQNDEGDDYYVVEIWEADFSDTQLLRAYKS